MLTKGNNYFFSLCALACVLLISQTATAQSGRRTTVTPAPTPPTPVIQSVVKGKTEPDDEPAPSNKPDDVAAVTSIIVGGEVVHDYAYYKSNDLDRALKECVNRLRDSRRVPEVTKGGKISFNEAKERAKKETDAYILWISFVAKDDGYGNMLIDFADYALLMPKSSRRLTYGRVKPDKRSVVSTGGVLGLPTPRTNRGSPTAAYHQMREIAWQIPDILLHGGWFGR